MLRTILRSAVLLGVVATLATVARAEIVTFNIIQGSSSLTVGGDLTNNTAFPQSTGSTTTSYTGTIRADVQPGTISFPGGSLLDAVLQAVNQQPQANAQSGSAAADYGRTAGGPSFQTSFEALRGVQLDVEDNTSGVGIPVNPSTGAFASDALRLFIDAGNSDVHYGIGTNEISLAGRSANNTADGGASTLVTSAGGTLQTLTLRLSTADVRYTAAQSNDTSLNFTGTIVATRTIVPEPAAGAAMLLLVAPLLRRRRA